ncbi:AtzH-like domain-containing protein [Kineococcus esterisolvens]|uniref:AtzH-like domain-containing protein n=1 Tax=unclassified Kineococcus TaxID=2621656 RepID=UPI003D7E0B7B
MSAAHGSGIPEQTLLAAAARYERALREDDLAVLDEVFADGSSTLRAEGGAALVGHADVSAHRARRGGAPARWQRRVHVRALGEADALTVSEAERLDGAGGLQTQLWHRFADGWKVTAAHVSSAPAPSRAAHGTDRAAWRVRPGEGDPLLPGSGAGPLRGARIAVKDLFALAGQRIGAGVPAWLNQAPLETSTAPAVQALLDAGSEVTGIAQTDELAFSLMGVNAHWGTPRNPAAPAHLPGGSTSGPAAAVAAGGADLGLGTDTAGSLRVPGSFCGLYAWRPSHGAVDTSGVLPLAPSFDTVGLLAADPALLAVAADVLLPPRPAPAQAVRPAALLRSAALLSLATPRTALAVDAALTALAVQTGLPVREVDPDFSPEEPQRWTAAFRTLQAAEAWASHGEFIDAHPGALSPAVERRFRHGQGLAPEAVQAARAVVERTRGRLEAVLADGWLCLPSTAAPAPRVDASAEEFEAARTGTLRLTTLASQTGVPALNLPWGRVGELPVGLCVLAPRGSDRSLLALLAEVAPPRRA